MSRADIKSAFKPTSLDRVIGYFSPRRELNRRKTRMEMAAVGSYVGASKNRHGMSSYVTRGGDADGDTLRDLPTLRERSRDLVRNDPVAGGAISTTVTEVVGPGLKPQMQIDREFLGLSEEEADKFEADAERAFAAWAGSPDSDAERAQSFYGLQGLAFRSTLENGDCFALLPMIERRGSVYRLAVQLIEADRVCNKDNIPDSDTLSGGIAKDKNGAPISYHILKQHPGVMRYSKKSRQWVEVSAYGSTTGRRNVLHLMNQLRVGQTRGIPWLAPVIGPLKQLTQYTEAELTAAVVSGLWTIFIKTEAGDGLDLPVQDTATSTSSESVEATPGGMIDLKPGEDVVAPNPGRPNAAFDPFFQAILRQVGMALELPYEVLIKHYQSSYSAARAAMLTAWKFYMSRRSWLTASLCQPVLEAFIDDEVASGRLSAPNYFADSRIRHAYTRALWIGPAKGMIDERKEIAAAKLRVELGITTLAEETASIAGGDFDRKHNRTIKEVEKRIAAGLVHPAAVPLDSTVMTVNEKRESLKLEPIPEGDSIFKSTSEIPALEMPPPEAGKKK